jgi:hypothetical protein
MVLAHNLYLLTKSILKGLDKDTHYMVTPIESKHTEFSTDMRPQA